MRLGIYSLAFKTSYLVFIIPNLIIFIPSLLSAKKVKGSLSQGLKKNAAGSIIQTALIFTYNSLEKGRKGILSEFQTNLFFLIGGVIGAILLIWGYFQIYQSLKKHQIFKILGF